MLPTVAFDNDSGTYTFTLWRDDKQVVHELKGLAVYLEVIPDDDYEITENVKYYIYVKTYNREEVLILLTKDEYDLLEPMIEDIEDKIQDKFYGQDSDCSFCGSIDAKCGRDHGDEMRQMQREALRDDTY
jgi:hypothetical protein